MKSMLDKITSQTLENFLFSFDMMDHAGISNDVPDHHGEPWFVDAALIEHLKYNNGSWIASLVFANYKDPYQILVRTIPIELSLQKAQKGAYYMKKRAAEDQRASFRIDIDYFDLCYN